MKVLAAGDCGVDRYEDLKADRAGGISLNFAVNARLEFPDAAQVGVVTALGSDAGALRVENVFATFNINSYLQRLHGVTPVQYIDREPSGEKIFTRYEPGVLAGHQIGACERAAIAASDLMVAAYYPAVEDFINSIMRAPSRGLRCVDFGALHGVSESLEPVTNYLEQLNVGFFGLSSGQTDLIDQLEELAHRFQRLFVVTLAAQGSVALGAAKRLHCEAVTVDRVVDTTGAGDTFIAGFLSEYAYTGDVSTSLQRGSEAAARSVRRVGAFDSPLVPWDDSDTDDP